MKQPLPSFQELITKSFSSYISYNNLLSTQEWLSKRLEIINRDNNRCYHCGKQETWCEDFDERHRFYYWFGKETLGSDADPVPEIIQANKPYWLEVHHKYYLINKLPWNYDDNALITLCNWCHREVHKNEIIKVYNGDDQSPCLDLDTCHRCGGNGWIPEFSHVQGGICFNCRGTGNKLPKIKIQ